MDFNFFKKSNNCLKTCWVFSGSFIKLGGSLNLLISRTDGSFNLFFFLFPKYPELASITKIKCPPHIGTNYCHAPPYLVATKFPYQHTYLHCNHLHSTNLWYRIRVNENLTDVIVLSTSESGR